MEILIAASIAAVTAVIYRKEIAAGVKSVKMKVFGSDNQPPPPKKL